MKRLLLSVKYWSAAFGLDPRAFLYGVWGLGIFWWQYCCLKRQITKSGKRWRVLANRPCLLDRFDTSGPRGGHYFHQDLLVASRVYQRNPYRHIDVGSSVVGFVSHLAVFRTVECLDIRKLAAVHQNIIFRQCDLMNIPPDLNECCDSLSCLHVLEHFGLGRYGDSINCDGHLVGLASLARMLKPCGVLYLSVPIGDERVEFNGHRVFALDTIFAMIKDAFKLIGFSYVDDFGGLHENIELSPQDRTNNLNLLYGCGIFELEKLNTCD